MKNIIKNNIDKILNKLNINILNYQISENSKSSFGDYSTNIGLITKKSNEIARELEQENMFKRVEIKNGFINLFIRDSVFIEKINRINNDQLIDKPAATKKYNVEFISANPTGPLTIGNGRGGFYGNVLSNILEFTNNKVIREYYVNDIGNQINELKQAVEGTGENYKAEYIDKFKMQNAKLKITIDNSKLINTILNDLIKPTLEKINIHFDKWFYESSLYPKSIDIAIAKLQKLKLIYEKDHALWVKTSKFGDDKDRVIKKAAGEYTYFMGDIGYLLNKINRGYDELIFFWGADHHGYIPRFLAVAKALGIDEKKIKIIICQLVRLTKGNKEFKISKREGNLVTLDDLVKIVGLDATRYFFLSYDPNTHIDFNLDKAKDKSKKNPVYYIQYAYVRICRILSSQAIAEGSPRLPLGGQVRFSRDDTILDLELSLIKKLIQFEDMILDISQNYQVNKLPAYTYTLAREVQLFYEKNRIIGNDRENERLAIIHAGKNVLEKCLDLMGISKPKEM